MIMDNATLNVLQELGISVQEFETLAKKASETNPNFEYIALAKLEQLR